VFYLFVIFVCVCSHCKVMISLGRDQRFKWAL